MKYIHYFCSRFLGLLCLIVLYSCHPDNPQVELLLQQAEQLMIEHPDSAYVLLESIPVSDRLSPRQEADYCLLITQARDKCYEDHAKHNSDSIIAIACSYYEENKKHYADRLMLALYYSGRVAQDTNDALRAQDYYLKALEVGEESTNYLTKGLICNHLGTLYTYQEAYELALPYLKGAVDNYEKIDDKEGVAFTLRNIARVYKQLDSLEMAYSYYEKSLSLGVDNPSSSVLNELGSLLADMGKVEEGLTYSKKALQYIKRPTSAFPVYLTIGRIYSVMNQADSSRYYLNQSLSSPHIETRTAAYYHLYHLAKEEEDYHAYIQAQTQYELLRDSIRKSTDVEVMCRIASLYNYQRIEQKVYEYQLRDAISQRNNYLYLFISVLLLALSMLLLYLYKHQKRLNRRREEKLQQINKELQKHSEEASQKMQKRIKE